MVNYFKFLKCADHLGENFGELYRDKFNKKVLISKCAPKTKETYFTS